MLWKWKLNAFRTKEFSFDGIEGRCEALRKGISLYFHFLNAVFVWYLEKDVKYFYDYLIHQEENQEN